MTTSSSGRVASIVVPAGEVLAGGVHAQHQRALLRADAVLVVRARVEPRDQRRRIHLQHEDLVEEVHEEVDVARPPAEEGRGRRMIGDQLVDAVDVPDVVLVARAGRGSPVTGSPW